VTYRLLEAPGIADLTGRGVYYGAARISASALSDEDVYIVGGANSAGQAAVYYLGIARSVTMLVRGSSLSAGMSFYLTERIEGTSNIHVRYNSAIVAANGNGHLESVEICDWSTNIQESVPAGALFIFIGASPPSG